MTQLDLTRSQILAFRRQAGALDERLPRGPRSLRRAACLISGELAGTWRRADTVLTVQPWRRLSDAERDAVTAEAEALPLPGLNGRRIALRWDDGGW